MPEPVFTTSFRHSTTGSRLTVQIFPPVLLPDGHGGQYWRCDFTSDQDGNVVQKYAGGVDWMQALLLAYTVATKTACEDETLWETEDGLPAWCIVPKTVPISWKYDFYRKCCDFIEAEEAALLRKIEERRRARGEDIP